MYTNTTQINAEQVNNVWTLYKKHPIVGICTRAIENAIFSEEIVGLEHYKKDIRPALRAVARASTAWMLCIGLVPIVLNQCAKNGEVSVHVPDREC
jgi:hypothetical protein